MLSLRRRPLNEVWPQRSLKVTKGHLNILKLSFTAMYFCLKPNLYNNFSRMSILWRQNFFLKWRMTWKVIQGHIIPLLCQNYSGAFVYAPILMKICRNANIFKEQYFHKLIYHLKCHFTLWISFVIFYFKTTCKNISTLKL